jgi:hypothetical protein
MRDHLPIAMPHEPAPARTVLITRSVAVSTTDTSFEMPFAV